MPACGARTALVGKRVRMFLAEKGPKYQVLVEQVRSVCETIASEQPETVRHIYGRDEKQEGARLANASLKAPNKIAKKWLTNFKPEDAFSEVPDIAGLTAVIYDPHQITGFITVVANKLSSRRINASTPKVKKSDGYYATHVVFTSRNIEHVGLKCELQVKTMLHEAWSSKTHDLSTNLGWPTISAGLIFSLRKRACTAFSA